MSGLSRSVKCVVVNETEFELVGTLDGGKLNWDLEHGSFDGGIDAPPAPIAPNARAEFTTSTAGLFTGTEGWVVYGIKGQNIVVSIEWKEPFIGTNSYTMKPNALAGATREIEEVPIGFTDRQGKPISFADARKADDVIATYTVRLKPLVAAQASAAAPPPVEKQPPVAVAPKQDTTVVDDLPAWARNLSDKRKRLLAGIAHIIPQSTVAGDVANYDQGGTMLDSAHGQNKWWTGEGAGTSCTGFQPKVMEQFFKGGSDPNATNWSFNTGGADAWTDSEGKDHAKVEPHPNWKGVDKHPPPEMPQPGDTYLLFIDYEVQGLPAGIRHVGNIVYAPAKPDDENDCWVTADGGQNKKGVHCQFVPRVGVFGPAKRGPRGAKGPFVNTLHFRGGAEAVKAAAAGTSEKDEKAYEAWKEKQDAAAKEAADKKLPTPVTTLSPRTKDLPHLVGWVLRPDELSGAPAGYDEADFRDVVKRIEKVRAYYLKHKK